MGVGEQGSRRERLIGVEVVEPEQLRERRMELPIELVLEAVLGGKVLLLDTDSAYQAKLMKRRLQRLARKKGINAVLVHVLVEADEGGRYAIMLRETLEQLLREEKEAEGEAAEPR